MFYIFNNAMRNKELFRAKGRQLETLLFEITLFGVKQIISRKI